MYNSFQRLKFPACSQIVAINCERGFRMYNSFERLKCLPCSLIVNARPTCELFGSEVDQVGGDVRRRFLGLLDWVVPRSWVIAFSWSRAAICNGVGGWVGGWEATDMYNVVVVVVLTLARIIKFVVTGQAPVTLELRNTPGKKQIIQRWHTHISQLTQIHVSARNI